MDDLRQLSDTQRHQRISELRAQLQDSYTLQAATDLMYLELLPPNKPGPIGTPRCPICASPNVHEHSPDEIVIYRNGIRFGRATHGWGDGPGTETPGHQSGCHYGVGVPCICGLTASGSIPKDIDDFPGPEDFGYLPSGEVKS